MEWILPPDEQEIVSLISRLARERFTPRAAVSFNTCETAQGNAANSAGFAA